MTAPSIPENRQVPASRAYLRTCRALGLRHRVMDPGEGPNRVSVWSVRELAGVQSRLGGRLAVAATADPLAVDVTLTVSVRGIGVVVVETEASIASVSDGVVLAEMETREARLLEQRHQLDPQDAAYRHLAVAAASEQVAA